MTSSLQRLAHAVAISLPLAFAGGAHAAAITVDFEDLPSAYFAETFSSHGFDFAVQQDDPDFYDAGIWNVVKHGSYCAPAQCPNSGSNEFMTQTAPNALTMTAANGAAFGLVNFRGAGGYNFNDPAGGGPTPGLGSTRIDVVGTRVDGSVVRQSFAIDNSAPTGPLPFTLDKLDASFNNLKSVVFSSSGAPGINPENNAYALDDIVVSTTSPVPEPATPGLLLAGLAALGLARRRARR